LSSQICPEIKWTGITVNVNYEARPHIDKNNDGASCVVAFGDYEGGELCIDGTAYSLRHRPLTFHASSTYHAVKPITSGTRYSVVFYRTKFPPAFSERYGPELGYKELMDHVYIPYPCAPLSEQVILV
jgi:hypothetical protein